MDMSPEGIRQMRLKIVMAKHRGDRMDGRYPSQMETSPVAYQLRAIMHAAEAQGISGEDVMTVLAYHALVEWEKMYDRALGDLMINLPVRSMMLDPSAPAGDAPVQPPKA